MTSTEYPVRIDAPEHMNMLGLMLGDLLERRAHEPAARRHARRLSGDVAIDAGGMRVVLRFDRGRGVLVTRARARRPVARVRGSLRSLVDAALEQNRLRHVATGRLRAWGHPLFLLHLLAILRA